MNRTKLKKVSYVTANACGKMTRITSIASVGFFVIGLIASLFLDGCERKEIKESFKSTKK